jgi:hypothetical protein
MAAGERKLQRARLAGPLELSALSMRRKAPRIGESEMSGAFRSPERAGRRARPALSAKPDRVALVPGPSGAATHHDTA